MGGNTLDNTGSAYLFKRSSTGAWNEIQKITASDRDTRDYFSRAVAINGNNIIIGAPNEDDDASGNNFLSRAGSCYAFSINTTNSVKTINASNKNIQIYPNPTQQRLIIDMENLEETIEKIVILNSLGQIVHQTTAVHRKKINLDLSSLANGCYNLYIEGSHQVYNHQIIKY